MPDIRFFDRVSGLTINQVLELTRAHLSEKDSAPLLQESALDSIFSGECAPLNRAGQSDVAFFADKRYLSSLIETKAGFVLVNERDAQNVPKDTMALISTAPQTSWGRLSAHLYRLKVHLGGDAIHASAKLEAGVVIGHGAVIGQGCEIGAGSHIGAYSVIGPGCVIGRQARIGAHASISCSLIGDYVSIASGARIGEAGFGVSYDETGPFDMPQLGRVIIQDHVSIGAGTCVDRGAFDDTVIGEASKIDNMVQIAHNVIMGCRCIVAAHSGISGSVRIGAGAKFGGRAGVLDHIEIGEGALIGAGAVVTRHVPRGEMWTGFPAKPSRQYLREQTWLSKQASHTKQV